MSLGELNQKQDHGEIREGRDKCINKKKGRKTMGRSWSLFWQNQTVDKVFQGNIWEWWTPGEGFQTWERVQQVKRSESNMNFSYCEIFTQAIK